MYIILYNSIRVQLKDWLRPRFLALLGTVITNQSVGWGTEVTVTDCAVSILLSRCIATHALSQPSGLNGLVPLTTTDKLRVCF